MTPRPAIGRSYRLHLAVAGDVIQAAHVDRTGPDNPLMIAQARTVAEGLPLASLLFPLCPAAHMGAALDAIEQAAGLELPEGQAAAREAVLLAEAVSGAVWRAAMQWPLLVGQAADPEPVRAARGAAAAITAALYDGSWAHPGGAALSSDQAAAEQSVDVLANALGQVAPLAKTLEAQAMDIALHADKALARPLGDTLAQDDLDPDHADREETPRVLTQNHSAAQSLADWFTAQHVHGLTLLKGLKHALDRVRPDAPIAMPGAVSGRGLGVAMTARGRLRHCVALDQGRIVAWRAAAPTDWNFAPLGPVAQAAKALHADDDLADQARWLIGAFDPCAPCDVVMEAGHA